MSLTGKIDKILIIALFCVVVNSCSHQLVNIPKLEPAREDYIQHEAKKMLTDSIDRVRVFIVFSEATPHKYVFEVSILNFSDKAENINPSGFYYKTFIMDTNPKVPFRQKKSEEIHAFEPLKLIAYIDSVRNVESKAGGEFCGSCLTGLLCGAISQGAKIHYEPPPTSGDLGGFVRAGELENRKTYFRDNLMYQQNLVSKNTARGLVVFPFIEPVKDLVIYLPVGSRTFEFKYYQPNYEKTLSTWNTHLKYEN